MGQYLKKVKRKNFIRRVFNLPGIEKERTFISPGVYVQERDISYVTLKK